MSKDGVTSVPVGVVIAGGIFGGLTLLFFMALVIFSLFGREVPCSSRFLIVMVIAFGAALSIAFLGGAAAAKGSVPLPFAKDHPITFSVSGGIAVLLILLALGSSQFVPKCDSTPQPIATEEIERPEIKIWLDEKNGIHRNAIDDESHWKLTWVILKDGNEVLSVNALGDTSYDYFKNEPGVYTVYIEAWIKDRYQAISNIVSYEIEP